MSTNVDSLFTMTRPVWEGMRSRKFGRVISISSVNGQKGQFGQTNYAAAKAAAIGFTKALAQEGARARDHGQLRVPGLYRHRDGQGGARGRAEGARSCRRSRSAGWASPRRSRAASTFLASDEAGFITGSTLSANGGQYMA